MLLERIQEHSRQIQYLRKALEAKRRTKRIERQKINAILAAKKKAKRRGPADCLKVKLDV
jgi:hypothetical protein